MKKNVKTYLLFIAATEAVGAVSALLTRGGVQYYNDTALKPPLSPPAIVFPIAWGVLYALMATGASRVYLSPQSEQRTRGLRLYAAQLAMNFFWSVLFFDQRWYLFAAIWLAVMLALIVRMTVCYYRTDKPAAYLQIPYIAWVAFAAYLNVGVWLLNR